MKHREIKIIDINYKGWWWQAQEERCANGT